MAKQIPHELVGVFAALPTPFAADGRPWFEALDALVDFALARGLKGLCLGGATGEYAACSVDQRVELFRRVAQRVDGRAHLICAVGGEHAGQVRELAQASAACGARALLFPPPGFLPYAPEDLVEFMGQVSAELPRPVLIYNLPQYTRELGIGKVLGLIARVPNIVGLKDSSGERANLAAIRAAQAETPLVFMIGSDDLFLEAFAAGAVGAISGIAGACPELILPLYEALRAGQQEQAREWQARLDEFIAHIQDFPSPWAMKLTLQARGLAVGHLAWPLGEGLCQKVRKFQNWFAAQIATYQSGVRGLPAQAGPESLLPRGGNAGPSGIRPQLLRSCV
jgi:4-hydroxy-tetrahydrodipicolinate synthase